MSDQALPLLPMVSLTIIRRVRISDGCVIQESDALVWNPTAMRLVLDEKPGRHPVVAMLAGDRS